MKQLKKLLALVLAAACLLPAAAGAQEEAATAEEILASSVVLALDEPIALVGNARGGPRTEIDLLNPDVVAKEVDGRTLLPVAFVARQFGAVVDWDGGTSTVTISYGDNLATMVLGEMQLTLNGEPVALDVPVQTMWDRTMLPIRVVAEQILDKHVLWDGKGLVVISPQPLTLTDAEVDGLLQEIRDPAPLTRPYYKPASIAEDTVEQADALLEQWADEDDWCENFVPKSSPRDRQYSPVEEFGYENSWSWDPAKPNEIKDNASGLTFPNEDYPYEYLAVTTPLGKEVQVPVLECYNTAMCDYVLVEARIDYEKQQFLEDALNTLTNAYYQTGDERYARRIILSLNQWADNLPNYYITEGWNVNRPMSVEEAEEIGYARVEWTSSSNGCTNEISTVQVYALDAVYDSPTFAALSEEKGYDVKAHVIDDFYGEKITYMKDKTPVESLLLTNLPRTFDQFGQLGVVLHRADVAQWLGDYLNLTVDANFKRDKMFPESATYHFYCARENRDIAYTLKKYFQAYPEDIAATGDTYGNLNEQIEFLSQAMRVVDEISYPDGNVAPYGDCDGGVALKRNFSQSAILPAYGVAHLADGTFDNQTMWNIGAIDTSGHTHYDRNSIQLYAFGAELLGDIKYVRPLGRKYANDSTFSHNTVLVDGKDQQVMVEVVPNQAYGNEGHWFNGGNIELFADDGQGVAVSDVTNDWAYEETSRYQRMNILNTTDESRPYIVDIFAVEGGSRHEYLLHSSTAFDSTWDSDLDMEAMPGERPLTEPGDEWVEFQYTIDARDNYYPIFRNVSTAESEDGNYLVNFTKEGGDIGVNIHMAADESQTVYVGESPTPYRGSEQPQTLEDVYKYYTPFMMARREGAEGLKSVFVSVIEPFQGEGHITGVERLETSTGDPDHIALRVTMDDGRVDTILADLNGMGETTEFSADGGAYVLNGKVGVNCTDAAGQASQHAIAAPKFSAADSALACGVYQGTVSEIHSVKGGSAENAFVTDAELPTDGSLDGQFLSLEFGTYHTVNAPQVPEQDGISELYEISHVERRDGKTYVYLADDPALALTGGKTVELMRPMRTFDGAPSFTVGSLQVS